MCLSTGRGCSTSPIIMPGCIFSNIQENERRETEYEAILQELRRMWHDTTGASKRRCSCERHTAVLRSCWYRTSLYLDSWPAAGSQILGRPVRGVHTAVSSAAL